MIFTKKNLFYPKFFFSFYFITINFSCYYCSIDLKRQSEHSGLRPDTSNLVRLKVCFG